MSEDDGARALAMAGVLSQTLILGRSWSYFNVPIKFFFAVSNIHKTTRNNIRSLLFSNVRDTTLKTGSDSLLFSSLFCLIAALIEC